MKKTESIKKEADILKAHLDIHVNLVATFQWSLNIESLIQTFYDKEEYSHLGRVASMQGDSGSNPSGV